MDPEYKRMLGTVEGVEQRATSDGKPFFKIKIDGKTYNWFTEECGIRLGDNVEGMFFEVPNPNNVNQPFKNVKEIQVKERQVGLDEKPKADVQADLAEMNQAKTQAAILIGSMLQCCDDPDAALSKYKEWLDTEVHDKIIVSLYNRGKTLREQIIRGE
jgi:hypothetical protein